MPIARRDWPQLLNLVEQALEVPAPDRAAWAVQLGLRAPLHEALLRLLAQRASLETGTFLAALPELPHQEERAEVRLRIAPGSLVGPWQLLRQIGEGGMSSVWLAQRADGQVRRNVALKMPHAGPGQDVLAQRMRQERNILASLEHAQIARLYDVGVTDAGVPYLAMEYVAGQNLIEHADKHMLGVHERLALYRQVLSAVHYAHGRLVLHRDLKPPNILVDQGGSVKLLDFGIASLLASPGESLADLTQAAERRLTPAYASPEQLRGERLGTSSDLYSLGVVLYELLGGTRPFHDAGPRPTDLERSILEREPKSLGRLVMSADLAAARRTTPAALRKTLSGDLNAIVLKALAKAPNERYASVDALDDDIACWLTGRPVAAHTPGPWYYAAKFIGRHRWQVAAASAAVLSLAALSTVAFVQAHHARQQAARASTVRDFLVAMLQETSPDHAAPHELSAKSLLDNGRRRALTDLTASPDLRGELLHELGDAQSKLADRIDADKTYELAIAAYIESGNDRARLLVLLTRIDNLLALGRTDRASVLLSTASDWATRFEQDAELQGELMREQGYVALFRRDWSAAREAFERNLLLTEAKPEMTTPLRRVQVLQNLAIATARSGDFGPALDHIAKAAAILRDHPQIPVLRRMDLENYRQDIHFQWGRYRDIARDTPDVSRQCDALLSPKSAPCLKLKLRLQGAHVRLGQITQAQALNEALTPLLNPSSPRDRLGALAALARVQARAEPQVAVSEAAQPLQAFVASPAFSTLDANYQLEGLNALAEIHLLTGQQTDAALSWTLRAETLLAGDSRLVSAESTRTLVLKGAALHQRGEDVAALSAMGALCTGDPLQGAASRVWRVQTTIFALNCVAPLVATGQAPAALTLVDRAVAILNENLGAEALSTQLARRWRDGLRNNGSLPEAGLEVTALIL